MSPSEGRDGMTNTGMEMGMITNLITDMSIQGARPEHVVRAVRHSMVVIDAVKHELNWKQSERDNQIDLLKQRWQKRDDGKYGGASTLISKATSTDSWRASLRRARRSRRPYIAK